LNVLESEKDYLKALVMAFRLNEAGLIKRVFQAVPPSDIALAVGDLPTVYVSRLLRFVAAQTEESPHIEFCLLWIKALIDKHGKWLAANRGKIDVELRIVSRAVSKMRDEIRRLADENVYMVDYLLGQAGKEIDADKGVKTAKGDDRMTIDLADGEEVSGDEGSDEWIGLE
jgi:periodic tryptophan protein 2